MPFMFWRLRKLIGFFKGADWSHLILIVLALYLMGLVGFPHFEGPESPLSHPFAYTWYFVVTIMTVGYGDISPVTTGGRTIAMIIMMVGITAIATAAGKAFEALWRARRIRMEGKGSYEYKGHLVIIGYQPGRTERLIRETRRGGGFTDKRIVLISDNPDTNPFPGDGVDYVRGEPSSDDVLNRGSVASASRIIIDPRSDDEGTAVAIATMHCNTDGHIVIYVINPDRVRILEKLDHGRLETIPSLSVALMAHAIGDPGISEVIERLLSYEEDASLYMMPFTDEPIPFDTLLREMLESKRIILLGIKRRGQPIDLNPKPDTVVTAGDVLFYIGDKRVTS